MNFVDPEMFFLELPCWIETYISNWSPDRKVVVTDFLHSSSIVTSFDSFNSVLYILMNNELLIDYLLLLFTITSCPEPRSTGWKKQVLKIKRQVEIFFSLLFFVLLFFMLLMSFYSYLITQNYINFIWYIIIYEGHNKHLDAETFKY